MKITHANKLASVQRLKRARLLQTCQTPRETELLSGVLNQCSGETLGEIRSDLVELTDQRMKRCNTGALLSMAAGVTAGVVAGISGRPWLAAGLLGGGILAAGACVGGTLDAYQDNSRDMSILLAASGRALETSQQSPAG